MQATILYIYKQTFPFPKLMYGTIGMTGITQTKKKLICLSQPTQ